jgi:rfaE bifunctional protein kinase chain/domain
MAKRALIEELDFSAVRVLLVGDLILDRFIFGTTRRISREAPIPVVQFAAESCAPGGAANAAANLASLGATVMVAGLIGEDESGDILRGCLEEQGIDTSLVRALSSRQTTVKTRVLAGGAGTVRQQVLRLDREPEGDPSAEVTASLHQAACDAIADCDVAVLSDYGYGAVAPELCARFGSTPVVVDSRSQLQRFAGAHTLKPNLSELEQVAGRDLLDQAQVEAAALALRERSGAGAVLVTLGRNGMILAEADRLRSVPVFGDDEVADVTGAGDSVLAAFALATGCGLDRFDAAQVATVAGAVAVSHYGTHSVRLDELRAAVRDA